ncbi:Thioesterase superfamily [Aspergillus sclerotialis]|uniref:Thioesterase superfamily n=1 Tax=Aspergillus sclerotialis TaxID=2070753 RepID=A0A3A2ZSF7_9EURO|nr:Thioesterase superfamily [Aspergillus sclerotialis]
MYNHTYKDMIATLPISQEDVDFFSKLPFARPYIDNFSSYTPVPFVTRYDKGDLSDTFFSRAINSNETIPRALSFMRKPDSQQHSVTDNGQKDLSQSAEKPFFVTFCQIESGVNGYINTAHGGVIASLLDETLGLCAEAYRVFSSEERGTLVTAKLEVSYRAPVPTPSVIVIKTWVKRQEDRKWFLEAQLLDKDGSLKVEAKSLYVKMKSAL